MKRAVILHGMPEEHEYQGNESEMHWIPWLKEQLEKRGVEVFTPELPKPYEPVYEDWLQTFQQFLIDEETVLVGHSCGGGFLVRYLSESDVSVGKVVLVAPWLDPTRQLKSDFFDFTLDPELVKKTKGMTVFISLDDGQDVLSSVETLTQSITGITLKQFANKGHFTFGDMGQREFPELLQIIL